MIFSVYNTEDCHGPLGLAMTATPQMVYTQKGSVNRCKSVSDKIQVEKTKPISDRWEWA